MTKDFINFELYPDISDVMPKEAVYAIIEIASWRKSFDNPNSRNGDYYIFLDKEKTIADLQRIRAACPNDHPGLGSYVIHKNKGHKYYFISAAYISQTKLWRVAHSFADAIVAIEHDRSVYVKENEYSCGFTFHYENYEDFIWTNDPELKSEKSIGKQNFTAWFSENPNLPRRDCKTAKCHEQHCPISHPIKTMGELEDYFDSIGL